MNINPKVRNGSLAGALSIILVYVLTGPLDLKLPTEVVASIPVIITAIVGYATSQGAWTSNSNS